MIANLPLLFADGNPTALSKIKADKLEKFITFMVTCSWGHDTAKEIRQPPWWPSNVAFSHPFVRPREVPDDWELRLKSLVKRCYDYHKSAFLLVFSAQLARYQHKKLRYVDNRDHTTSLYYRPNGRLLVTFRNENLFYDRESREEVWSICSRSPSPSSSQVKPAVKSTDIYLCDNCDSHFDNFEVLKVHERLCNNEDAPSSSCNGGLSEFLSALKLLPIGETSDHSTSKDTDADSKPRHVRSAAYIDRGPPYPFSSLAYIKNAKINAQRDTSFSRERIERYCCTLTSHSKNLVSKGKGHQFAVRYRRPIDYWKRKHVFPSQRNKKVLDLKGQLLLLKCRPITVEVPRMSLDEMQAYIDKLREEAEAKLANQQKAIVFVDPDQPMEMELKIGDPLKKIEECEVIDLCSDDETPSVNENCDPRAGVTCVMRGGAVLRRTAATPQALPAEPCGARQRPLPSLILQPHPVILITHTLNNLQAIALD